MTPTQTLMTSLAILGPAAMAAEARGGAMLFTTLTSDELKRLGLAVASFYFRPKSAQDASNDPMIRLMLSQLLSSIAGQTLAGLTTEQEAPSAAFSAAAMDKQRQFMDNLAAAGTVAQLLDIKQEGNREYSDALEAAFASIPADVQKKMVPIGRMTSQHRPFSQVVFEQLFRHVSGEQQVDLVRRGLLRTVANEALYFALSENEQGRASVIRKPVSVGDR